MKSQFLTCVIFVFCLFQATLQAQESLDMTLEKAIESFSTLEKGNRYQDNLSPETAGNLPFGIKKSVAGVPIRLAVSHIKFMPSYTEATLFVRIDIPQTTKSLFFGAKNIKLSYDGDLVGETALTLLKDIPISKGNLGKITLKSGLDKETGEGKYNTHVVVDCNGDFKHLSIDAEIELNNNTFIPDTAPDAKDKPTHVTGRFTSVVEDLNNWMVSVSLPPFQLKAVPGFVFNLTQATLDMSDLDNPATMVPPGEYFRKHFFLPDVKLWQGIYVQKFELILPPEFNKKGSSSRIQLLAENLLIDENGITATVAGKNILTLGEGDANGWPFSVEDFSMSLVANNITGFGFGGKLKLPTSKEQKPSDYNAFIGTDGNYLFNVSLGDTMDLSLIGGAVKAYLKETSYVQVKVDKHKFKPSLVLDGYMTVGGKELNLDKFTFKKLQFTTEAPYLSAENFNYEGNISLKGIPVSIDNISLRSIDKQAGIAFDMKLNLMSEKISASTRANIMAEYKDGSWGYKSFNLEEIALNNIEIGGFSLSGSIYMKEDDPVYGDCFGGSILAQFSSLSPGLKVGVDAIFGRKDDFRYWFVEGMATFPGTGIPIGPVSLNGFTGGAYYHMKASKSGIGKGYIPDKGNSLGVRAGVSFMIASEKVVSGDALFEMNFLSGGGIGSMRFFGQAAFMNNAVPKTDLKELKGAADTKSENLGTSLASNQASNQSGTTVAKNVYPMPRKNAAISAFMTMEYDFTNKTFDANFEVAVSAAGGLLRGVGEGNVAGWAHIYASPESWFIHMGTPTRPIGIQIGFGDLSLKTTSYIMVGDQIPAAPAPPREVTDILGISAEDADYMKEFNKLGTGKGFAFGSSVSFDTGDLSFLIIYARFRAGIGFDVMLKDFSEYRCEGRDSDIGINGWYANGQCYAYLQGELGVKINLFFVKKRVAIIKGGAATLLQARLPDPTWFGGYMALRLNVLGGLVNANMKMKFSFGDECKIVRKDGEHSPVDMPMISDLSPDDKSQQVDIFTSPQATFNMPIGEVFTLDDENGTKSYRIRFDEFYVQDNKGSKLPGNVSWNQKRDVAEFTSKDVMPPNKDMTAFVSVKFEEWNNGSWNTVMYNGKEARETKKVQFKTGEAPNYIPLKNIKYAYPVVNQKNCHLDEIKTAYVQLKQGQPYLFPDNFQYQVVFTAATGGEPQKAAFTYNAGSALLSYDLPALKKAEQYDMAFAAVSSGSSGNDQSGQTSYQSDIVKDDEGTENEINYKNVTAQEIVRKGMLTVLEYDFRSSRYGTFVEKLNDMQFTGRARYVSTNVRSLILSTAQNHELFDEAELTGTAYTGTVPLIKREAILTDDYYTKDIAPLIYNWYPSDGIKIQDRDESLFGAPPVKAFNLASGYLSSVTSGTYNASIQQVFPFVYDLSYAYHSDYYDLRDQIINRFVNTNLDKWRFLLDSYFPFIRQGKYKTKFEYILPDGKKGTGKELEYECDIK